MKKSFWVTAGFAGMIALSLAFTNAAPRYKNLKVLPKNTTKEQMDSIMHHFTSSLNVKCNFCHVRLEDEQKNWDFASDKNEHKLIARRMMQMTNKINKKYFEADYKANKDFIPAMEVTCYTCHNGKVHPANNAAAAARQPRPQAAPPADSTRRQQ